MLSAHAQQLCLFRLHSDIFFSIEVLNFLAVFYAWPLSWPISRRFQSPWSSNHAQSFCCTPRTCNLSDMVDSSDLVDMRYAIHFHAIQIECFKHVSVKHQTVFVFWLVVVNTNKIFHKWCQPDLCLVLKSWCVWNVTWVVSCNWKYIRLTGLKTSLSSRLALL